MNSLEIIQNTGDLISRYLQIAICNKLMSHGQLAISNARKLHTYLGHIKAFQKLLKVSHIGMRLNIAKSFNNRVVWEELTSCFKVESEQDLKQFFQDVVVLFKSNIKNILKKFPVIKVNATFCGEFIKNLQIQILLSSNILILVMLILMYQQICTNERDSGFAVQSIISLEVNINKLEMGNACINVQNDDQACFYWSIVSALYPKDKNPQRTSVYPHYSVVLNTENLDSPMSLQKISKFEKINNISVNVYSLELIKIDERSLYNVVPAKLTKNKLDRHVNLLLVQNIYFPKLDDYEAMPVEDADTTEI
nr:unnamed protein product [Callosobruchus chinensis]